MINLWCDRDVSPGEPAAAKTIEQLDSAELILLLVSPDFNATRGAEVKKAMERHSGREARVVPVILRPVEWADEPFGILKALPSGDKAIVRWDDRDEAFLEVTEGIKMICKELRSR